jgi:hypothetical protein
LARESELILASAFARTKFAASFLAAGLLAFTAHGSAADLSLPVTGNLIGSVLDGSGTPQMGATVLLFNKYERLIAKTLTAPDGRFSPAFFLPHAKRLRYAPGSTACFKFVWLRCLATWN